MSKENLIDFLQHDRDVVIEEIECNGEYCLFEDYDCPSDIDCDLPEYKGEECISGNCIECWLDAISDLTFRGE